MSQTNPRLQTTADKNDLNKDGLTRGSKTSGVCRCQQQQQAAGSATSKS